MKSWGIRVTLVQPGFIHSGAFAKVVLSRDAQISTENVDDAYHAVYKSMAPFIARLMGLATATPDAVADRVMRVVEQRRPPLRVSATIDARVFYLLRRVLPRRLYHLLLYHSLPSVSSWGPSE